MEASKIAEDPSKVAVASVVAEVALAIVDAVEVIFVVAATVSPTAASVLEINMFLKTATVTNMCDLRSFCICMSSYVPLQQSFSGNKKMNMIHMFFSKYTKDAFEVYPCTCLTV